MEKIGCICAMRDLVRALCTLENELLDNYGITLNEAMVLCSMADETVNAGTVAERTGLAPSHCSKVINSAEKKGLLTRSLNNEDKRQMYFSLTDKAKASLAHIREKGLDIPSCLRPFFDTYNADYSATAEAQRDCKRSLN